MADDAAPAGPSELQRLRARVAALEAERAEYVERAEHAENAARAAYGEGPAPGEREAYGGGATPGRPVAYGEGPAPGERVVDSGGATPGRPGAYGEGARPGRRVAYGDRAARGERATHPPRHRLLLRSLLAALLILLGCVLAPLSLVAAWSADLVGDTDRYVDTVAPLARDGDVQNAAADAVTGAVMHHLDLPALLQGVAPGDRSLVTEALGRLGPSLESAVRSFVHDKARAVVASDAFERIWTEANRRIHGAVDEALTGGGDGTVTLDDKTVSVDLGPVVEQVKRRLVDSGLTVAGRIPELHTRLTVVESEDIGKVRTYVRILRLAGVWLPVLAVLLVTAGVLLAAHRRRALITASLCFALAALVLGAALTVFRGFYLDALPSGVSRPAAGSVYDTLIRYLRAAVRTVVALGVVIATAAWLSGPGRWAGAVRQIWHSGIGAARGTADRLGLRTGPVGPFARRFRTWITWLLVAGAVVAYALWTYPTGWVVLGLALTLLFALSVLDFLAEEAPHPRERTAP